MFENIQNTTSRPKRRSRAGYSLLELVVASGLMAAVLVPALALVMQGLELSREVDTRNMLATRCVGLLEEHLALGAATFTEATASGDFSSDGYPQLRYYVVRSAAAADGGIPDRLMAVTATVWEDVDSDSSQDSDEPSATFASKLANMALYLEEAGGS